MELSKLFVMFLFFLLSGFAMLGLFFVADSSGMLTASRAHFGAL